MELLAVSMMTGRLAVAAVDRNDEPPRCRRSWHHHVDEREVRQVALII